MSAGWTRMIHRDALRAKGRAVLRRGGKQIALFHTADGVFACNNRCPHEGYPLREGNLDGCILTCNWHNWKFDLKTGANHFGGERLRVYPVALRDGDRSEEHTSELQSRRNLVCRLLLEKKNNKQ